MKVYEGKVPIFCWCNEPEEGAIEQAKNLASLPFIFNRVCLMPDTHQGYGMPIGGVIATNNVIIPNAVGVDIGCGMCAMRTSLTSLSKEEIKAIFGGSKEFHGGIRSRVPVGFDHRGNNEEWVGFDNAPDIKVIQSEISSAKKQLGTLGGGNHFIELQKGSDGFVWIMIHSGSRNFGYKIAKEYNTLAQQLCSRWYSNVPEFKGEDGLAFLPLDTKEGQEYVTAMNFALEFAYENRKRMLRDICLSINEVIDCTFEPEINIHHNYAQIENHFGKNVMVHRKGATLARAGQLGIIPGSQGTNSYIVIGKGNAESFQSCSHGAGRRMSRTKAINNLSLENEIMNMESLGVVHSIRHKNDLDECASAYKNIEIVMEEQKDLVDIMVKLTPLGVIKG